MLSSISATWARVSLQNCSQSVSFTCQSSGKIPQACDLSYSSRLNQLYRRSTRSSRAACRSTQMILPEMNAVAGLNISSRALVDVEDLVVRRELFLAHSVDELLSHVLVHGIHNVAGVR